jgi:hypothetical protein
MLDEEPCHAGHVSTQILLHIIIYKRLTQVRRRNGQIHRMTSCWDAAAMGANADDFNVAGIISLHSRFLVSSPEYSTLATAGT